MDFLSTFKRFDIDSMQNIKIILLFKISFKIENAKHIKENRIKPELLRLGFSPVPRSN